MNMLRGLVLLCLLFSFGCTLPAPLVQTLPESNLLVPLNDDELFAVRPDGEMVAYVADGLHILGLSDNYQQQLTYDEPDALIWTPDGSALVAAFREAEKTRLVRLGTSADDRPQTFVDEIITDFAWLTDGRLLAMAQVVEYVENVLQVKVSLLIWNGQWDVERIPLYSRDYLTSYAFDKPVLHSFDLSPLKDELIYNRYLDPPFPEGQVEMVLYNLHTRQELIVAETDNRSARSFCSADGENFLTSDVYGRVKLFNPWTQKDIRVWPSLGESLQIAPLRNLFYIDGNLYLDDQLVLSLPVSARARFSDDGERMFVAWQRKLYLYPVYNVPEQIQFSKIEKVKLKRIRQQRSLEEISIHDYYQQRNNILNP
ncbi:hypothetical protein N9063_01025 [Deltaproteobacteria bacterium]|nr:hypothetical protein [Deltaproteobacteria bacterium]